MRLLFLLLISPIMTLSITIHTKTDKKSFSCAIKDIPLNMESFDKNLKSGISNQFLMTLTLFSKQKEVMSEQFIIKVVYDLWDEVFNIRITSNESSEEIKIKSLNAVKEFLSAHTFHFKSEKVNGLSSLSARYELVLDPLTKEKQKKIKTWIAENRVNMPSTSPTEKGSISLNSNLNSDARSQNSNLVNSMLNNELSKETTEGSWKFTYDFLDVNMVENLNEK